MKIAGSKNQGAWFRFNKQLKELRAQPGFVAGELRDAFLSENGSVAQAYFTAVNDLATKTGVNQALGPQTSTDMVGTWINAGIPLQVWMGRLSFDTYTLSGPPNARIATPDHQSEAHEMGKAVRRFFRRYLVGRRAYRDLVNLGNISEDNPGGYPDATTGPGN